MMKQTIYERGKFITNYNKILSLKVPIVDVAFMKYMYVNTNKGKPAIVGYFFSLGCKFFKK